MRKFLRKVKHYFLNILTIVLVLVSLFPIVWLLMTALKTEVQAFSMPPVWFFKPTFKSFEAVLRAADFMNGYKNSLIVALGTAADQAAYH
jgi:multiple sugar transport system permease protein